MSLNLRAYYTGSIQVAYIIYVPKMGGKIV